MFAVTHQASAYGKPLGIWWWDGVRNCPTSFYLPAGKNFYARAVGTLGGAHDQTHWQQIAQKLADRTPYSDNYEVVDVQGDPRKFLKEVAR